VDKRESFSWSGLECLGNRNHFDLPRITLLNSHQSKQPKGNDDWVRNTSEAIQAHRDERIVLLSSTELPTWEFVVWLGGVYGIPQIIVVADYGITSRSAAVSTILQEFELDSDLATFLFIKGQSSRPKSWWANRDELILNIADRLIPISIRPGGHLDDGLKTIGDAKGIDESFKISWSREQRRKPFQFDLETIRREVDPPFQNKLIHWTRAADGPWPGESRANYYKAVSESGDDYARSAAETLKHILAERRIRASPWRIRDGRPVVAFSGLPPSRATALMRWRRRYVRYSIEPYGIAIDREAAAQYGILPVQYIDPDRAPSTVQPEFLQAVGNRGEWSAECEYRCLGDVDLEALPKGSWVPLDLSP